MATSVFNAKLSSLNRKITANKSKNLFVENELKKPKTLIQAFLQVKSILNKMLHKII